MSLEVDIEDEGQSLLVVSPATGESLGGLTRTDPAAIPQLVEQIASVQPLWALLRVSDRAHYMRRVAQAIIDEFDELTRALARELGRPIGEVGTLELLPAIDTLIWIADAGAEILASHPVAVHRSMFLTKRARITYEPLGVVGVIGSSSAPFAQPLGQIAGALLAGNGVLFKPAAGAALAAERIAGLIARAGLPEGLVAVAHGGAAVGLALAQAPVEKLLFTGSARAGREIVGAAVGTQPPALDLDKKDAMLIASDAHVARAVSCATWAGFTAAGRARGSVERIYVHQELAERFTELLLGATRSLELGDPLDPGTQVGPLPSERHRQHVIELVTNAQADGAQLLCGGAVEAPPGLKGSFYAPALVRGASQRTCLMREPINGPVVALQTVASIDEALELINDCDCPFAASVWTADRHQALRVASELKTATVWMNDHLPATTIPQASWGAATGRSLGQEGLRGYAREKLLTWDPSGSRGLWWGPNSQTLARAAQTVAELRSARDSHRTRAWRHGALSLARVGGRALRHRDD